MLVLLETAAGYGLFKVLNEGKLKEESEIFDYFSSAEKASSSVKLLAFKKFDDISAALGATTAMIENSMDKTLKSFLKKHVLKAGLQDKLAVADSKMAGLVKEKLGIQCSHNGISKEIIRGIRSHLSSLLTSVTPEQLSAMTLGLAHSLSRYKLKFSADKVDTMVVQAINLLDELDKEINVYAMRVKEWYGWHYPEMCKIVLDNLQYCRVILKVGIRKNLSGLDLSEILESGVEEELKNTSVISTGVDLSEEDLGHIQMLCTQVLDLTEYRRQLFEYLQARMNAIAPNLSCMVGEQVGARLIAHAGSLMNLAKYPASTVQILGAEKALFRALKTKHETPKYGLIYHASLVGQAPQKIKGKISRILAAKTALSVRVDALGDTSGPTIGLAGRQRVEDTLRSFETGTTIRTNPPAKLSIVKPGSLGAPSGPLPVYSSAGDVVLASKPEKRKSKGGEESVKASSSSEPAKKKKKHSKKEEEEEEEEEEEAPVSKDKKKKKHKKSSA